MFFRRKSEKIEILKKVPIFQNLSRRELDQISRIADEVEAPQGKVLIRQGEPGREFILIVDGTARVEHSGTVIAHVGPGDFLGEIALIDGKKRTATVTTETPAKLLVIHWSRFWPLLESIPGVQRKIMVGLAARLRERETTLFDS